MYIHFVYNFRFFYLFMSRQTHLLKRLETSKFSHGSLQQSLAEIELCAKFLALRGDYKLYKIESQNPNFYFFPKCVKNAKRTF